MGGCGGKGAASIIDGLDGTYPWVEGGGLFQAFVPRAADQVVACHVHEGRKPCHLCVCGEGGWVGGRVCGCGITTTWRDCCFTCSRSSIGKVAAVAGAGGGMAGGAGAGAASLAISVEWVEGWVDGHMGSKRGGGVALVGSPRSLFGCGALWPRLARVSVKDGPVPTCPHFTTFTLLVHVCSGRKEEKAGRRVASNQGTLGVVYECLRSLRGVACWAQASSWMKAGPQKGSMDRGPFADTMKKCAWPPAEDEINRECFKKGNKPNPPPSARPNPHSVDSFPPP